MKRFPHWTILCVTLGAFLLPLMGGHLSIEAGHILPDDNLLTAILNGDTVPFVTHFLISLLFFIPLTVTLFTHKISHVANLRITFWLALFGACAGVSISVSNFPAVTILSILDWTMMSLAFFAVTLCCGRKQSAFPLLGFVAGATLVALFGILEFRDMRVFDPGYRIFAHQISPNQAGALFASGTLLTLVMSLRYERLAKLGLILAAVLQCFALFLTQSKGAIICLPIGILVVIVGLLATKAVKPGQAIAVVLIPLVFAGFLGMTAQKAAAAQSGSKVVSRLTNGGAESAQSAGFRKLLWQSAIDLTKEHPYGWGMGSFWYESTRPGRVTQTTLTHQTFLQITAEASPIASFSLAAFIVMVVAWGLRGIRQLSQESKILLVGVAGALSVAVAHNFIDSDMYIFGLGAFVFLLCGSFTASSADSQAPEFIFALPKWAFAGTAALLIPLCVSVGLAEMFRAKARGYMDVRDRQGMSAAASSAISSTFADGQAYALRALAQPNEDDFLAATRFLPSPKSYRALADFYLSQNKIQECFRALEKALERDPNNAAALKKYVEAANQAGDEKIAREKAEQLIATENTTYFTVRSQPEFIPTQTYAVRIFLASITPDKKQKAQYLADAIKGFRQYRDTTGPVVLRDVGETQNVAVAGEDKGTLRLNYTIALDACKQLETLQREAGVSFGFDPAEEAGKFAAALESLNK